MTEEIQKKMGVISPVLGYVELIQVETITDGTSPTAKHGILVNDRQEVDVSKAKF